jgi:hypothetical protein
VQAAMINKLWPHLVWWFSLCKDVFHELWATSSLHTIIHTFKKTLFKSNRVFIHFFLEFGHLYEGVAWFTCHSTGRMSKILFLNKHQIIFWNQNARSIFQNSNRETDFGKRDELCLWDHARLPKCICEFL